MLVLLSPHELLLFLCVGSEGSTVVTKLIAKKNNTLFVDVSVRFQSNFLPEQN